MRPLDLGSPWPHSCILRVANQSTRKVTATASNEGNPNDLNQTSSGGIFQVMTSRFAGFEIGRTKLAAFAISAQISI